MEEMDTGKRKISGKLIVFLFVWLTFVFVAFIFPESIRTCAGKLVFGVGSSLMVLAIHVFLRNERDTQAKRYFWYVTLVVLLCLLGFWFYDTLSDCGFIGNF
jgi:hypothetical protein